MKTISRCVGFGLLILPMAMGMAMAQEGPGLDAAELYRRTAQASVEVLVGGQLAGSGWLADSSGLVVTASHVVWGAAGPLEVRSPTIGRVQVRIIASDRGHDLSLLELPKRDQPYPSLGIAPSGPEPLAEVYLFGQVIFRHQLLLAGRIARPRPSYEYMPNEHCVARVLYMTGSSPVGTSGGCWVDNQARVVSTQSGYISTDGKPVGVSYGAPPQAISRLVLTRQSARTPDLGVVVEELWEHPPEFVAKFPPSAEGVVLAVIVPGGPADQAGLKAQSLVIGLQGRPIRLRDEFYDAVRAGKPGEEITLRLLQPGDPQEREVKVKLTWLEK